MEFAKVLNNDDKRLSFIFDCLLASRCDKPLTNEQVEVINNLCNLWKFSENDIHLMVFWVSEILGSTNNLSANNDDSDYHCLLILKRRIGPLKNIKFKVQGWRVLFWKHYVATGNKKISEKNTIAQLTIAQLTIAQLVEEKHKVEKSKKKSLKLDYLE